MTFECEEGSRRAGARTGFLDTTPLANTITETHFMPGDLDSDGRMGRLATFMARMTIGYSNVIQGLALAGNTALLYDFSSQTAQVVGSGSAYFISAPTQGTLVLQAGIPLTYTGLQVHRVSASSGVFNWENAWSLTGTFGSEYGVSVNNGVVTSTTGSVY